MMVQSIERRHSVPAWAASIALHGVGMTVVGLLLAQMRPLPLQETFQWNVSLVQPLREHPIGPSGEAIPSPAPHPDNKRLRPTSTTSQAVRQKIEARPTHVEATQPSQPLELSRETPIAETAEVTPAPSPHEVVTETQVSQVEAVPKESITPATLLESAQPVSQNGQETPAPRPDYGWLIRSLATRLAELKQYPALARSNGLEGKVLLRAVIRADGSVAEISVQHSSGHTELDAAAVQTMRNASPLHLQHELDRSQVAITVPLVYRLTN